MDRRVRGGHMVSGVVIFLRRAMAKGGRKWGGELRKGVGGQYLHKSEEFGTGANMSRGGGGLMGNQQGESEGVNGWKEFQAAGIQHQLQLQVAELAGVVRNLAQQVNQIKAVVGGKGVIGDKSGGQDLGASGGRDVGWKGMEVGNYGRGSLQGDWLKLRLPKYERDILWWTYIK